MLFWFGLGVVAVCMLILTCAIVSSSRLGLIQDSPGAG